MSPDLFWPGVLITAVGLVCFYSVSLVCWVKVTQRTLEKQQEAIEWLCKRLQQICENEILFTEKIEAHHAAICSHQRQLEQLIDSNNNMAPSLDELSDRVEQLDASFERLTQINYSTIETCGAAQRFYDALLGCNRVPEQELIDLGKALAEWQAKGRLN